MLQSSARNGSGGDGGTSGEPKGQSRRSADSCFSQASLKPTMLLRNQKRLRVGTVQMPRNRRTAGRKPDPTIEAKAQQMVARLRDRYRIGKQAAQGDVPIAELAAAVGLSGHTVRRLRRFATAYSEVELDELCQLRRPNGLPLHVGFIAYLLIVSDKKERAKLQQRAAREGWGAAQLSAAVPKKFRGQSPHGRPIKQPSSPAAGLRQVSEEADRLCRRTQLVLDAVKGRSNKRPSRALQNQAEMTAKTVASLKHQLAALERELRRMADE